MVLKTTTTTIHSRPLATEHESLSHLLLPLHFFAHRPKSPLPGGNVAILWEINGNRGTKKSLAF